MPRCESTYIPTAEQIAAAAAEIRADPERETEFGNERYFIAGILEHMVGTVRHWYIYREARGHLRRSHAYQRVRRQALAAAEWLLSDETPPADSRQFSFAEICDFLGLDIAAARERIFAQFDPAGLRELA